MEQPIGNKVTALTAIQTPGDGKILNCKSVAKFCLLYFSTILVLILIFTSINNEPMDSEQKGWWWGFVISLILTASMSLTALIIVLYTDCNKNDPEVNIADREVSSKDRLRPVAYDTKEESRTFKTILTIDSRPPESVKQLKTIRLTPNQLPPVQITSPNPAKSPEPVDQTQYQILHKNQVDAAVAQTYGHQPKSPVVTVVDMRSTRPALAEAANMAAIPSATHAAAVVKSPSDPPKPPKKKKKKKAKALSKKS